MCDEHNRLKKTRDGRFTRYRYVRSACTTGGRDNNKDSRKTIRFVFKQQRGRINNICRTGFGETARGGLYCVMFLLESFGKKRTKTIIVAHEVGTRTGVREPEAGRPRLPPINRILPSYALTAGRRADFRSLRRRRHVAQQPRRCRYAKSTATASGRRTGKNTTISRFD